MKFVIYVVVGLMFALTYSFNELTCHEKLISSCRINLTNSQYILHISLTANDLSLFIIFETKYTNLDHFFSVNLLNSGTLIRCQICETIYLCTFCYNECSTYYLDE